MIITVTRIVIIGDKRIERTATAQISRGITRAIGEITDPKGDADEITATARALFESIEASDTQPLTP